MKFPGRSASTLSSNDVQATRPASINRPVSITESEFSQEASEERARARFVRRQGAKTWLPSTSLPDGNEGKQVFVDADAMKEKVRQNLSKPQYSVLNCYHDKGVFQHIARSLWFDHLTLAVIAVNAGWLAVDTDYNHVDVLTEAHPVFVFAENIFCTYFSFELFVRFMAFRRKIDGLKDAWFSFDAILVLTMVLETWVMTCILLLAGGNSGGDLSNASILRIARLLRLSRMARMARLLRAMPELMTLIKGMVAATRSVFFTLCLLTILTYVFAIAFTQLTDGTEVGDMYFRSVPYSMYTLLLFGTLLDEIGQLSNALETENFLYAGLFFVFVLLAALTVMNMLIGVLCEVVSAVAATEKEAMLVGYVSRKVQGIVNQLDSDGNGTLSRAEFFKILENYECARALQEVGVDVEGLVDFADVIFDETPDLSFPKFMEWVLQLRGTNHATVKDIVELRKLVTQKMVQTHDFLSEIGNEIKRNSANIMASRQQLTRRLESTFGKDFNKEIHDSTKDSSKFSGSRSVGSSRHAAYSGGTDDELQNDRGGVMNDEVPIEPFTTSKPSFMQPVCRQDSDHSNWSFGNEYEPLKPTSEKLAYDKLEASVYRLGDEIVHAQGHLNLSEIDARDAAWHNRLATLAQKGTMATALEAQSRQWNATFCNVSTSCSNPIEQSESLAGNGDDWGSMSMDELREQIISLEKVLLVSLEEVRKIQHGFGHSYSLPRLDARDRLSRSIDTL